MCLPVLTGESTYCIALSDGAGVPALLTIQIGDDTAGGWVGYALAQVSGGSPVGGATSTGATGAAANVWVHVCGVFTSATSRAIFVNGGNKGTDTTSVSVTGLTTTVLGGFNAFAADAFAYISDAAVWNVALTDAEVAALGRGMSPLFVRPSGLISYWPLETVASAGLNRVKASTDRTLTAGTGSAVQSPIGGPPVGERYYSRPVSWRGNYSPVPGLQAAPGTNAFWKAGSDAATTDATAYTNEINKLVAVSLIQSIPGAALVASAFATASPAIGTATLVQTQVLAAPNLAVTSPAFSALAVKQGHVLLASDASAGAPTLDAPAANQKVAFTATALAVASPVLSSGFVAQAGVLASVPLATGVPVFGAPAFNQAAALAATALAPSSPTFTAPAVTLALPAADLVVGSPVLPAATLVQVVALVPVGKTVAAPAVGSSTIAQTHAFLTLFEPQLSINPTVDLAFAYRRADAAAITVTRANAQSWAEDTRGNWTSFPANVPRITDKGLFVESAVINQVPNNSWQGAVVGVVGSGGAFPTNWGWGGGTLTREVVAIGVEANGVEYIDLRFSGPSGGTGPLIITTPTTGLVSAAGQPWSVSAWMKLVAGSLTAGLVPSGMILRVAGEAGGTLLDGGLVDATWKRITNTRVLATGTTAQWTLRFATVDAVTPIDFTIRLGWPQLENAPLVASPVRTTTVAVTRQADIVNLVSTPPIPSSGGLFVEFAIPRNVLTGQIGNWYLLEASDGTAANRALLYVAWTGASGARGFTVTNATVSQGTVLGTVSYAYNEAVARHAARFADNDMRAANDGLLTALDNAAIMPAFTSLDIGKSDAATAGMRGYIRRVKYFNQPPTDNDLQLLTGGPGVSSPVLGQGLLQQKHVLVPVGITVASPAIDAADFAQENALVAVDKTVGAPALGVSTITKQGHALATPAFAPSAPVLGVGALHQKQVLVALGAVAGQPVLGVPTLVQAGTCVAVSMVLSRPVFGPTAVKQMHNLAAPRLSLSSGAVIGTPKAVIKAPPLFAANLTVGSPQIAPIKPALKFANLLAPVPDFYVGKIEFSLPDAELIAPPDIFFPVRFTRWSNDPNAEFYDHDHSQFGRYVKQAIFTNMNDDIEMWMSAGTLAGRTTQERGPVEDIIVSKPLWLTDKKLGIDWSEVEAATAAIAAEIAARIAAVAAEIAARTAAVAAEIAARTAAVAAEITARSAADSAETAARVAADSALDARLVVLETRTYVDMGGVANISPASGFVHDVAANAGAVIVNLSSNISSGTFRLPIAPTGRQKIDFIILKNIANVTFSTANTGHALANAPTSASGGKNITAVFGPVLQTWLFFS